MENNENKIIQTEEPVIEESKKAEKKNPEIFKSRVRLFFMTFSVTVLIGFIIGMVMFITGNEPGNADKFYEKGVAAVQAQNYEEAKEYLLKALEKDSEHVGSRIALCETYENLGLYEEAYDFAIESIEKSPATYEFYGIASRALCYQGKMSEAREFLAGCTNNYVLLKMENSRPSKISFSSQPGTYGEKISLSLSSSSNAVIYYTTDGSEPNLTSKVFSSPIEITDKCSIRAFAISETGILTDEQAGDFRVRDENAIYKFVDEAVESVVRDALGIYEELTYKDLDELESFSSENSSGKITTLADFSEFLNLSKVELYGDTIADYSPLNQVPKLKSLTVNRVELSEDNLKQIAGCVSLTTLDLSECSLTSVEALAPMTSLMTLTLNDNDLGGENGSADSLAALKDGKITKLVIKNNGIKTLGGIGEITSLRNLDVSENNISGLSDIGKLNKLDTLTAKDNAIESASGLSFLTSLRTLDLSGNALTDITGIASAKSVSSLDLSNNAIEDFSPLSGTNLNSLTARSCGIEDISSICRITSLRSLDVSDNNISSLSPVAELPYISELNAADNYINTIKTLRGVTSLTSLDISGNDVDQNEAAQFNSLKINWG